MKNLLITVFTIFSLQVFSQENKTYKIGDFAQGGIIFWLDDSGQHGLVCAKEDQGSRVQWDLELIFKGSTMYPPKRNTKSVAIADGVYVGKKNTEKIIEFGGDSNKAYAAIICSELILEEDSCVYEDWYLPSREELNLMYKNRKLINKVALGKGGSSFNKKHYWSSTDVDCTKNPYSKIDKVHTAWGHDFNRGGKSFQIASRKYMPYAVRAIRAF